MHKSLLSVWFWTTVFNALQESAMAEQTCYEGSAVQSFQFYLEHSGEHKAILQHIPDILPGEFKRYRR